MSDAEKARSLFLDAIGRDPSGACTTFLEAACGDDAALRARVERLLEAHRLLGPMPAADAAPRPVERPGSTIGPYKLLEEIGEGGMGVVYMAEQA